MAEQDAPNQMTDLLEEAEERKFAWMFATAMAMDRPTPENWERAGEAALRLGTFRVQLAYALKER